MDTLLAAANRMWTAAFELDRIRADDAATDWLAGEIRSLMRSGEAESVTKVAALADALDKRLAES